MLEQFVTRFVKPGLFYKRAGIVVNQRLQGLLLNNELIFDLNNFPSKSSSVHLEYLNIASFGLQNNLHVVMSSCDQFDAYSTKWLDKLNHIERKKHQYFNRTLQTNAHLFD